MPGPLGAPRITTERLLMRGWDDGDRDSFAAMNADPRVSEYLVGPITRADSDELVDRVRACWRERGFGLWAVERRDSGAFVGYVGLWPADFEGPFTPAVEVGWRLAPAHWGRGFATEGGREALRYGFDVLGLPEIVSFTGTGNARSRRVMERLGMTHDHEGDFAHPAVPVGHRARPHVLYRLARADWARASAGPRRD